jgi:hypothetical protein
MTTLNIETFNEILFTALKDNSPQGKLDLLKAELSMTYAMKIEAMETVIHALEDGRDYMQEMERLRNIDQSCDTLGNMIDEIYAEHPELRKEK